MNRFASVTRPLMWFMAFMLAALMAGCGGGSGGGAPILGLPGVVAFTVTPATATIPVTGTQQFTAIETYSDGSTRNVTATSTWTSGTPAVAANPIAGLATGLTAGTTLITATSGGRTATATLNVNTAIPVSFVVTPTSATIPVLGTQQFTAIETFSDGSTYDRTAISAAGPTFGTTVWSKVGGVSGAGGVGGGGTCTEATLGTTTAPSTGLATDFGYAIGVAPTPVAKPCFILATFTPAGVGAVPLVATPATLIVNTAKVLSVLVTPVTATIPVLGTQQYTATAFWDNLTSSDVTAAAIWTTDLAHAANAAFGDIACPAIGCATGKIVTLAGSPVLITASFGGKFSPTFPAAGGASLTVTPALVPIVVYGPAGAPPILGMAGTYGIIASDKITISAVLTTSHIYGDVALTLSTAAVPASLIGFTPSAVPVGCLTSPRVTGSINAPNNCILTNGAPPQPYTDLNAAYLDLMNLNPGIPRSAPLAAPVFPNGVGGGTFAAATDLSGWILTPGIYDLLGADYGLSKTLGPLVLDAGGNPDAVFIIRSTSAGSGLTSTDGSVALQGKAQAKNVFWVMPGAPSIGSTNLGSFFQGTVVAGAAATLGNFSIVQGRILAGALGGAAAVTLSGTNTITVPQ